ncbi:MAG: DUF4167 domain-containing protein [Pseudomonadota bacterium]
MNMMRKNNNRNNNMKHRSGGGGGGGQRRYGSNGGGGGGGGNRGANDSQNLQRQKHHATQQLGKYGDMARNAQINGDRVDVEYYLQHVDHYTRVLADIAGIEAERYAHQREAQIIPGGPNDPNAAQHQDNANNDQAAQHHSASSSGDESSTSGDESSASGDTAAAEARQQQQQPRAPRPARRPQPQSDNGAKEANSNTTEIPLPGSILPPI